MRLRIDVETGIYPNDRYSLIRNSDGPAVGCWRLDHNGRKPVSQDTWDAIAARCEPQEVPELSDWGQGALYQAWKREVT